VTAGDGRNAPGIGGLGVDVVDDLLQGKMRGQSEKERKREERGKGKKLVTFAHGFVVQCLVWSRY
jgi:hypothetical protein